MIRTNYAAKFEAAKIAADACEAALAIAARECTETETKLRKNRSARSGNFEAYAAANAAFQIALDAATAANERVVFLANAIDWLNANAARKRTVQFRLFRRLPVQYRQETA